MGAGFFFGPRGPLGQVPGCQAAERRKCPLRQVRPDYSLRREKARVRRRRGFHLLFLGRFCHERTDRRWSGTPAISVRSSSPAYAARSRGKSGSPSGVLTIPAATVTSTQPAAMSQRLQLVFNGADPPARRASRSRQTRGRGAARGCSRSGPVGWLHRSGRRQRPPEPWRRGRAAGDGSRASRSAATKAVITGLWMLSRLTSARYGLPAPWRASGFQVPRAGVLQWPLFWWRSEKKKLT